MEREYEIKPERNNKQVCSSKEGKTVVIELLKGK